MPYTNLNAAILKSVRDGIYGLDTNGVTTFANDASTRLTGWTMEELVGHRHHMLIHHTKADGTPNPGETCPILAVCQQGIPYHCEEDLFWHKNGTGIPVSYTATPIWDGDLLVGAVVVFQDISARLRRDEKERGSKQELGRLVEERTKELRRTHAQLHAVLESAVVSIIAIDVGGIITLFNSGAESLLGYRAKELVGHESPAIFHLASEIEARGRELSAVYGRPIAGMDVFNVVLLDGSSETREWTYVHKDGHHIPICLCTSSIRDEHGEITGFMGVAFDISIRKTAEERMAHAKEAAEAANRAKSEFLATMSHEIRTPMNGVLGMAQLLRESGLNSVQRKRVEILCGSAEGLLVILNDILDFSKLEAGKLELESTDFDISSLVEGVVDLHALKAQEKRIELTCVIEPDVPALVSGDSTRLRQVVSNLLGNAVKFTSTGNIDVRVRAARGRLEPAVCFEIRDTGIGVPLSKQHSLFERFTQADASTTRQFGGTGLGLSIVRGIVEKMGGEVGFTSEAGRGSEFWFTVPLETRILSGGSAAPFLFTGKRILVVDDNGASRCALLDLLKLWRCEADGAEDGASALAMLAAKPRGSFDAIIIDLEMPDMRGNLLGDAIRSNAKFSQIPIVLLVPMRHRSSVGSSSASSFSAYVTKPVKRNDLGSVLNDILAAEPGVPSMLGVDEAKASLNLRDGRRILAVDDNSVNQFVIAGMLEQLGLGVDIASSGPEALKRLANTEYALVLTDCEMPGMDGYELSRLIRDPATAVINHQVLIIAMTAHVGGRHRENCLLAGMNDYLTKPLQTTVLHRMLERWLPAREPFRPEPPRQPFLGDDLVDRLMGSEQLAKRIVESFLEFMPPQLEVLAKALRDADARAIADAAHAVKGAAANAGASAVQAAAAQLESLGRSGNVSEGPRLLVEIANEFEVVTVQMLQFCETLQDV